MTETIKIILFILFVGGALFLAFRITGWKMKKACEIIIHDLQKKNAFDPASAVTLPYSKISPINIGLRDYRPNALKELISQDIVRMLEGERYYLRISHNLSGPNDRKEG